MWPDAVVITHDCFPEIPGRSVSQPGRPLNILVMPESQFNETVGFFRRVIDGGAGQWMFENYQQA